MGISIVKMNDTRHINEEHIPEGATAIYSIYSYDESIGVHLCEFEPSHELKFEGFTFDTSKSFYDLDDDVLQEKLEEIDDFLMDMHRDVELYTYAHARYIAKLPEISDVEAPVKSWGKMQIISDDELVSVREFNDGDEEDSQYEIEEDIKSALEGII